MNDLEDIETLFAIRYLLDDPNDIVNISNDINDLNSFPERLYGSYQFEWMSYVKKQAKLQGLSLGDMDIVYELKQLDQKSSEEFRSCLETIQLCKTILASGEKVKVIKTPLKTYIEQLLKI